MVKFEGKYELERRENFVEYLKSMGQQLPEEVAKKIREDKSVLIVEVEGEQRYNFLNKNTIRDHSFSFTVGRPFKEIVEAQEVTLEIIAKQEGNKITITSTINGRITERIYDFSENGLIVTLQSSESTVVAKEYFKRM